MCVVDCCCGFGYMQSMSKVRQYGEMGCLKGSVMCRYVLCSSNYHTPIATRRSFQFTFGTSPNERTRAEYAKLLLISRPVLSFCIL